MMPICILSITTSLLLLAYIVLPEIFPREHQILLDKRLLPSALLVSLICLFMPIGTLYWATRGGSGENEDKDDEDFY